MKTLAVRTAQGCCSKERPRMRNETIGVLDLRRNLSALLETTQRRP